MSTDRTARRLRAIYLDSDDGTAAWLGDVDMDADGYLSVAALNEAFEDGLTGFVNDVNGKDSLLVKVPPPPGAPMFPIYGQSYERSDPRFLDGLKDYALARYSLKLCTDEELKEEQQAQADLAL